MDTAPDYWGHWPGSRQALVKLSDSLVLAIPPQHQKFWEQGPEVVRAPAPASRIPLVPLVGFSFFLPDFSGYTPQNYLVAFDPNRVDVVSLEAADPAQTAPDAPGYYSPNMIKRALRTYLNPDSLHEMYGLKCFRWISGERVTCIGPRSERSDEDIMLYAYVPPFEAWMKSPIMQADYYSSNYGGTHIVWRTNVKNFPQWREIDAKIWGFIASWRIVEPANKN